MFKIDSTQLQVELNSTIDNTQIKFTTGLVNSHKDDMVLILFVKQKSTSESSSVVWSQVNKRHFDGT